MKAKLYDYTDVVREIVDCNDIDHIDNPGYVGDSAIKVHMRDHSTKLCWDFVFMPEEEEDAHDLIRKLWHRGDEKPIDNREIIMVSTAGKYMGSYIASSNKIRMWYAVGKYAEVNFTPKCRWAYLWELIGKKITNVEK